MKAYRLLENAGPHQERDGSETLPGEILWSDTDLVKRFPEKWKYDAAVTLSETPPAPAPKVAAEDEQDDAPDVSLGVDKSSEFAEVKDNGLLVFYKKGKGWFVADDEAPTVALNDKPLKKDEVAAFAEKHLDS